MGVAVINATVRMVDANLQARFFCRLTPSRRSRVFIGLLLTAGEFPQAAEHAILPPPANQNFVLLPDHGDRNVMMRHGLTLAFDRQFRCPVVLKGDAIRRQRTHGAMRRFRAADQRPEFHDGLVKSRWRRCGDKRPEAGLQCRLDLGLADIGLNTPETAEDP
jgi:hypothetical protein